MLRKMMRRIRSEHSALQKRPITVHPVCAARKGACLSATLLQLYVSSVPRTLCAGHSFPIPSGHSFPLYSVRIDLTDPGPTKPTWCSSLLWFMTIPISAAMFFNSFDALPTFVITSCGVLVTVRFVMSLAKMVDDASWMSPVKKHFACKYSASLSSFSKQCSHLAVCSLWTSVKREGPVTSPCKKPQEGTISTRGSSKTGFDQLVQRCVMNTHECVGRIKPRHRCTNWR